MTPDRVRFPALAEYMRNNAIQTGEFRLSSGEFSRIYCDGKLVTFAPQGIALVVDAILEELHDFEFDALGGMDMGATPILSAVALRSFQIGKPIPTFVVRKEAKSHGTAKMIEGLVPGEPAKVVVVDDVVTTGGSIIKAIEAVQARGHEVALALALLDRNAGGTEALEGLGVPYRPLLRIGDLEIEHGNGARSGEGSAGEHLRSHAG